MIDENYKYVQLVTDTNGDITNLLVDPSTDRLLIEIVDETRTTTLNRTKIDENYNSVIQVVDDNGVIRPLLTNSDGYLLIDLLIE